ncbi:hypothetical protein LCGC14_0718690 [marine sediment metagenome]|uniref:AbiTii domain-containing protein n=1 Tax=marine sediment metagenome TaxID=412755 RepID=A0A0F9QHC8_9ZZZZ
MQNNQTSPKNNIYEFFNTILLFNKHSSLESHEKLEIKIVAIKREVVYEIFYTRIEFISEVGDIASYEVSKNDKIIGIQEIFNSENLTSRIENDDIGMFYKFNDFKLYFDGEIKDLNIQCLKENIRIGSQNPYIFSNDQFYLFFNDNLYPQSYNKQGGEILKTRFYNKKNDGVINGDEFFKKFMKVGFGVAMKPEIIIIFPIKSFKISHYQNERDIGKEIRFNFKVNKDLGNSVYMIYKINDGIEKEIKPNKMSLPIKIPQRGNIYIKIYWNGSEELIEQEELLYEKSIPIYNFLDLLFSELSKVDENSLVKNDIAREYSNTISDLENKDIIGALSHMKLLAELINQPKIIEWINLELNGYIDFNKFYPEYRRFNAKAITRESDLNVRGTQIVEDPIGEILNKINDIENLEIYKDEDEYHVFYSIYNVNLSHYLIESNLLRQIVFGIMNVLNKIIRSIDSKLPDSMKVLEEIKSLQENYYSDENYKVWFYKQKLKAKKIWKSIYRYLNKIDLNFFSADIYKKEKIFNERLYKILKEEFPHLELEMNKFISGRIHVDLSEAKIAIEIKKLESNTPKDELIGQIKEDLRIGTFVYGIIFGIDYTSGKELTKYNELMFEDGKIYCIMKPFPY